MREYLVPPVLRQISCCQFQNTLSAFVALLKHVHPFRNTATARSSCVKRLHCYLITQSRSEIVLQRNLGRRKHRILTESQRRVAPHLIGLGGSGEALWGLDREGGENSSMDPKESHFSYFSVEKDTYKRTTHMEKATSYLHCFFLLMMSENKDFKNQHSDSADLLVTHREHVTSNGLKGFIENPYVFGVALFASIGGITFGCKSLVECSLNTRRIYLMPHLK